jgi:hypothetical protein
MSITLKEAANLVGVNTNSLIYLASNEHGKINMWSKYKPVKLEAYSILDKDEDWWKGTDGDCGIKVSVYTAFGNSSSGMVKDMLAGITWEYISPTGGTYDPYRLSDFVGYNPDALFPLSSTVPDKILLSSSASASFYIEDAPIAGGNLKFSDLKTNGLVVADLYPGVILTKGSGSSYLTATSTSKFGTEGSAGVALNNLASYVGTWYCGFYLSTEKITQGGQIPSAKFVPLALPMQQVTIYAAGSQIEVNAFGYWVTNGFYYSYSIKNNSNSTSVSGITIKLMRRTSQDYVNGEVVRTLVNDMTKTVAIGSEFMSEDIYQAITRASGYEYYLQMMATNAKATYNTLEEDNLG